MTKARIVTMFKLRELGPNQFEAAWNKLMNGEYIYKRRDKSLVDFKKETVTTPVYPKTEGELKEKADAIREARS